MPAITNDYSGCEMLNLRSAPNGRGPFVIGQDGSSTGSMTLKQERFLLRHDGMWVLNLKVFALTEREQQRFLYSNSVDVMKAIEGLPSDPVVDDKLPDGVSRADLLAGAETTASRILRSLRDAKVVQLP